MNPVIYRIFKVSINLISSCGDFIAQDLNLICQYALQSPDPRLNFGDQQKCLYFMTYGFGLRMEFNFITTYIYIKI